MLLRETFIWSVLFRKSEEVEGYYGNGLDRPIALRCKLHAEGVTMAAQDQALITNKTKKVIIHSFIHSLFAIYATFYSRGNIRFNRKN